MGIRILFLLTFIMAGVADNEGFGQDCQYQSPVSGTIISSGSYGEPRTAHFHAGIDFKQRRGIPFDTIFAVESGYISRIVIRPDGYGNALYIDHPCGQTSVYAHLYELAPHITQYAHDLMYKEKSYTLNHHPNKSKIKVSKGEAIGIMGSTGRSSGPHLHFEIRNTESEKSTNPALYNIKPRDDIPPVIRGVVIYTLTPDGQELQSEYYPALMNKDGGYQLSRYTLQSGSLLVGIGIHSYDTMNGAKNHNGIYAAELKVDGESVFRFKLDSLAFNTSRYIHSHMDYNYKVANRYVSKLFKNPLNLLDIYVGKKIGGEISLFGVAARQIEIRVFDIDRNRAELNFEIRRSESLSPYPLDQYKAQIRIVPDQDWEKIGVKTTIRIPQGAVAAPVFMQLQSDYADSIVLKQPHEIPLFKPLTIEQKIEKRIYPKEKYLLSSINKDKDLQRNDCKWNDDYTLSCSVSQLDNYKIAIDTVPPKISVISLPNSYRARGTITIQDNFNPSSTSSAVGFNIYLNDNWLLCQHDIKTHRIWWDMEGISSGQRNRLTVIATDASGNTSTIERTFMR